VRRAVDLEPAGLRFRTVRLDPDHRLDLAAVAGSDGWLWERDRVGWAGRGAALRIALGGGLDEEGAAGRVTEALAAIAGDDEVGRPGTGPLAVGALPFDRRAAAELVVPEMVVGRAADGTTWLTTVGRDVGGAPVLERHPTFVPADPDGFALSSPVPHEEWLALVEEAVGEIDGGRFAKVVLAREVEVVANRDIHVETVVRRLRSLYPACTIVNAEAAGDRSARFIAASPELLVSRLGDRVRSHPLAGTVPRSGDPAADRALAEALLGSAKDRAEHAWVVDDVRAALTPWCAELAVPAAPSIVSFRNVSHLGTLIEGRLAGQAADRPAALTLAAALHPTAAVGGTPRDAALGWLGDHERLDRGPYAGPVGWTDARGDGEWVVGIRSAVVDGARARLFAGVGVVAGSDPASELAETQFKLQALLAAVVRP